MAKKACPSPQEHFQKES